MKLINRKFTFNKHYAFPAIVLFLIEVFIALFIKDKFVRPYLGDVLVVIFIYCFVRSVIQVKVLPLAISVLFFSFFIEYLQYLNIVKTLGWEDSIIANTIIGNSFAWNDMLAYTAGFVTVLLVEKVWPKKNYYGNRIFRRKTICCKANLGKE